MRFIFCNHDHRLSLALLQEFAKQMPLEHVDIIEGPGFQPPDSIPATVYSRQDIYFERYDVDWSTVEPLDPGKLSKLREAEIFSMRMFDRYEKQFNRSRRASLLIKDGRSVDLNEIRQLSYHERKRIFLLHARYWWDRISKTKPHAMIHLNGSPHLVVEYIIFQICKLMGIRTVFLVLTPVLPKVLLSRDIGDYVGDLRGRLADYLDTFRKTGRVPALDAHASAYLDSQRDAAKEAAPPWLNSRNVAVGRGRQVGSRWTLFKQMVRDFLAGLRDWRTMKSSALQYYLYYELVRDDRVLARRYDAMAETPDLNANFVYVPLHYQPEETTSPLGGDFENQIVMVEMLSASLPPGWLLYVKEHPAQGSFGRERYLYDAMRSLPNVRLVKTSVVTFDLTRRSRAVATISGTAGWEALLRNRPVLVFGDIPYDMAPGAFRVRTASDCHDAFATIAAGDYELSLETNICFLRAIQDIAVEGWLPVTSTAVRWTTETVPFEQNVRNLASGLYRALDLSVCASRQSA